MNWQVNRKVTNYHEISLNHSSKKKSSEDSNVIMFEQLTTVTKMMVTKMTLSKSIINLCYKLFTHW